MRWLLLITLSFLILFLGLAELKKEALALYAINTIAKKKNAQVIIDDLSISFPSQVQIKELQIKTKGQSYTLQGVTLRIKLFSLILGRLELAELSLDHFFSEGEKGEETVSSPPSFPLSIDSFSCKKIETKNFVGSLRGSFSFLPNIEKSRFDLLIEDQKNRQSFSLRAFFFREKSQLKAHALISSFNQKLPYIDKASCSLKARIESAFEGNTIDEILSSKIQSHINIRLDLEKDHPIKSVEADFDALYTKEKTLQIVNGSLLGDSLSLFFQGSLTDFSSIQGNIEGRIDSFKGPELSLTSSFRGTLSKPECTVSFSCINSRFPLQSGELVLKGALEKKLQAKATFSLQILDEPTEGSFDLSYDTGRFSIKNIVAFGFGGNLEGEIALMGSSFLHGNSLDLSLLTKHLPLESKGSLSFSLEGTMNEFKGNGVIASPSFPLFDFESLTFEFTKNTQDAAVIFASLKKDNETLNSHFTLSDEGHIHVEKLSGRLYDHSITLSSPAVMSPFEGSIPKLFVDEGYLTLSYFFAQENSLTLHIDSLENIPAIPFIGFFSGDLYVVEKNGLKTATLKLSGEKLKPKDPNWTSIAPFTLNLTGSFDSNTLLLEGNMMHEYGDPITVSMALPLQNQDTLPYLTLSNSTPCSLKLKGGGPLEPLLELSGYDSAKVKGLIDCELLVEGIYPHLTSIGSVKLKEGTIEHIDSGAIFSKLSASLSLEDQNILLDSFSAEDPSGGTIVGSGSLSYDPSTLFSFEIEAKLQNALLVNLDSISATHSGKVLFKGDKEKGLLKGELTVDRLRIDLPKGDKANHPPIEVTYVNQPNDKRPPTRFVRRDVSWPIDLDVTLKASDKVFIQRKDLQSEWMGEVHVFGPASMPLLFGELKILQGTLKLSGKPLKLTEGQLLFNGSFLKKTKLYLIASQDIEEYTLDLILKGNPSDIHVSLRSNPPLSEKDLITLLLFGKTVPGSEEMQDFSSREAIMEIKHQVKGEQEDALSSFKNRTGIDRIEFRRGGKGEDEEMNVSLGKYITPSFYLGINKSLNALTGDSLTDGAGVCIQADVHKNIKVAGEVGSEGDTRMFLKWHHDY